MPGRQPKGQNAKNRDQYRVQDAAEPKPESKPRRTKGQKNADRKG